MKKTIQVQCSACNGTGLYSGFAEPSGEAVICVGCDGSGAQDLTYTVYEGRKGKRGIEKVSHSRGWFIGTGVGSAGDYMTYREFQQKIPEAKIKS